MGQLGQNLGQNSIEHPFVTLHTNRPDATSDQRGHTTSGRDIEHQSET